MIRYFHSVFDVENEELAVRFYRVLQQPPELPKATDVDFIRFLHVAKGLTDTQGKMSPAVKLSFKFLDYDNSGSIGSVDIMNLKTSFTEEQMDIV